MPIDLVKVHGTALLADDPRHVYRQKLARITLDSMVQFVGLLDPQGTVLEINKAALDEIGISLADVEGHPFWNTLWWQVSQQANDTLREYIRRAAQGEFVRWETTIFGGAGGRETLIIDASLMPVRDDQGRVVFIAAEGRDITERKAHEREIARQRDELARLNQPPAGQPERRASFRSAAHEAAIEQSLRDADRRKDEFLATLAHELRNPLAPIRNAVELLKLADTADVQVRTARDIVDRQVRHMVRLVDDLLDVSRITLGQVTLRNANVSLRGVLVDALEAAGPAIESGKHPLSVELPDEQWHVNGDPTRLSQVFQNLLDNAAKYTPSGGQIYLSSKRQHDCAIITVRDTGIGIRPEQQQRVFELFSRVHPDNQIKTSGLGIGLALARQLVELHGGSLELRSDGPGAGSEFTVTLPLRLAADTTSTVRQLSAVAADTAGKQHRILVVDDNLDAAESLAMLLRVDGRDARVAANGQEALQLFGSFKPEVVVLDIGLPDIDGYEVARRIRASTTGPKVLLLALTGWGQADDKRRALEAGFDQHLTKPVDPEYLNQVLALGVAGSTRA